MFAFLFTVALAADPVAPAPVAAAPVEAALAAPATEVAPAPPVESAPVVEAVAIPASDAEAVAETNAAFNALAAGEWALGALLLCAVVIYGFKKFVAKKKAE